MYFSNEATRLEHPQAGLIPLPIWRSHFIKQLSDSCIALMQVQSELLLDAIKKLNPNPGMRDKECMWLAIALSHPYLSDEALSEAGIVLNMTGTQLFRLASKLGRTSFLRYLEKKAPEHLGVMIAEENYSAFRWAAEGGHLDVLCYLEEKAPEQLGAMIAANNYYAFEEAAYGGHLDVLCYLEEKAPEQLGAMIAANNYYAFREAARGGHLDVLCHLEKKAPEQLGAMIAAENYSAFRWAAYGGRLDVLRYLEEKAPEQLGAMIAANDYYAFQWAAYGGHLDVLCYLEEKAPEQLGAMIAASDYYAFQWAARGGHLDVLRYLEEKAPEQLGAMIAANDYYAFQWAARVGHYEFAQYLLAYANVFGYAETHVFEYNAYVQPFVTAKIAALRQQKTATEEANPNAVFNLENEEEIKLLFYVVRHLIRCNDQNMRDDILFLLEIPAVKDLAHQAVSPRQHNELLRLALNLGNESAAALLMNIPAVRALAEQNNFYRNERAGLLDLSALARDRESSMTALSKDERLRLEGVINRYEPLLKTTGASNILDNLRDTLKSRYDESPASIKVISNNENKTRTIELPLAWPDFQALELNALERKSALKAYYQHKDHTAYRYLSKPNPWMHAHASYVYVDENNLNEKWSTFEEYQAEIALFYLAAIDEQAIPSDGYTLETRLEHFIDELAHIGRAHNWDKTRIKVNANGEEQYDEDGNVITEEYDDQEADRPSCYSGVKRRLFQSVQGHALLKLLTKDLLNEEIDAFVVHHFEECLKQGHGDAVKNAWEKCIGSDDMTDEDWSALKLLDVSIEKQQQLKEYLGSKYGNSFSLSQEFLQQVDNAFRFKQEPDAHLLNFGHAKPQRLFPGQDIEVTSTLSRTGFFSSPPAFDNENVQEERMQLS